MALWLPYPSGAGPWRRFAQQLQRSNSCGARPETPIRDAMTQHPVTVSTDDNGSVAAAVLREHRLKNLPVVSTPENRRLVGCLSVRRLLAHVLSAA